MRHISSRKSVTSRNIEHHRILMDKIWNKLNLQSYEDWYDVPRKIMIQYGAKSVLEKYNDSLVLCIQQIYPEFHWNWWKFRHLSWPSNLNIELQRYLI
jgi:hypothetical protein